MKKQIILIMLSDHYSISEKIILNSLNYLKNKKNIYVFIGNSNFFQELAKKTYKINKFENLNKKYINFFNIQIKKLSMEKYINYITDISINLLRKKKVKALITMPLNKKILGKKFPGFTEFFAKKLNQYGKENMLLYNNNLSVCPITTHVPIKKISTFVTKKKILNTINNINNFYKKIIKKEAQIKVCGLNPHAGKDFFGNNNEENKIIIPALKKINKKIIKVTGPLSADTIFINHKNKVILGMYHDQVLTTFKALKKFNAINITIGLKYLRISPDHGTGLDLIKKNKKINNQSFKYCINFCEKYLNV